MKGRSCRRLVANLYMFVRVIAGAAFYSLELCDGHC